ncbi:MAG: UDP-3-O-(3-hydroxymyristoyl)glucosamine N-acyltransferase, partial [candidate division NC10 bacterium]
QIAHNDVVGEHVAMSGQVGLAGSVRVGNRVTIGGQAGVADHVTIGEGAILVAQAGVPSDIPAGEVWGGTPSRPMAEARRIWAAERLLPELVRRVRALEKRLEDLERGRA